MTRLLGIDEGTTGVKVVLYDTDLRPLREARRVKRTTHPRPGWVEQDPDEVLAAVVGAIGEVLGDGEPVVAGLDHQGESVLAWDAETRAALSPIIVWSDKRAQAVLDRLAGRADAIRARSGLPLDPYFSAGKLAWLLEEVPAVADAAQRGTLRLGTVDAWLCDKLGAGFATDASTASRTQLAALGAPGWDDALCAYFGVPLSALPVITDSAGALGELRHPSWPCPVPLNARLVDQQAALAGSGCTEPGRVKATYGTGVFVLAHTGTGPPGTAHATGLLPTVAWRIGGRTEYALDGGVFSAGALVDWLAATLGLRGGSELAALASSVPDAGGARVLPALSGLGAPWWKARARGVLAGITGATTPAHLAYAALESIAWRVADICAAVELPLERLRVDGGLTDSALLLGLQADALGISVEHGPADATALGSAGMAAVGAGLLASPQDLGDRVTAGETVLPRHDAAWREAEHAAWRAFVARAAAL